MLHSGFAATLLPTPIDGSANDNNPAMTSTAANPHRQAINPHTWNTSPHKTAPLNLPPALAM